MARDLGTVDPQVHDEAEAVIAFWLDETPAEKRFARDDALDAAIARRFGALRDAVADGGAAGWRDDPRTVLAAVILLDQFSRNLFRGDARAFAADPLARSLADAAIAAGWDGDMDAEERRFLYMPFMHSEDMADQRRSLDLFGADDHWARAHADQIARFGRFPQRNDALGRETTVEEAAFLADPANHF